MKSLVHLAADGPTAGAGGSSRWVVRDDGGGDPAAATDAPLGATLAELLAMPLERARAVVEAAAPAGPVSAAEVLAPVDRQEVWAAGVTYLRSRDGRAEESADADVYERVYGADRPELFFKATPERVVGPGGAIGIRADSGWDVPEPEVGLVVSSGGEVFGYVPGDDVSSRSIEGENPLYLPQAKVYTRSCALGPAVVPVWEAPQAPLGVSVRIVRGGEAVYEDSTTTAAMKRRFDELVAWLVHAMEFPSGAVLLTGTGLVPDAGFTLQTDDEVTVTVEGVGALTNTVVVVGRTGSPTPATA